MGERGLRGGKKEVGRRVKEREREGRRVGRCVDLLVNKLEG